MDRNFFHQERAKEHQREISQELKTQALLNEGKHEPLTNKQAKRIVMRLVPIVLVIAALLFLLAIG